MDEVFFWGGDFGGIWEVGFGVIFYVRKWVLVWFARAHMWFSCAWRGWETRFYVPGAVRKGGFRVSEAVWKWGFCVSGVGRVVGWRVRRGYAMARARRADGAETLQTLVETGCGCVGCGVGRQSALVLAAARASMNCAWAMAWSSHALARSLEKDSLAGV